MTGAQLQRLPAPDDLAYAIADHLREATPGLPEVLVHPAWREVARWRIRRMLALTARRLALTNPWAW